MDIYKYFEEHRVLILVGEYNYKGMYELCEKLPKLYTTYANFLFHIRHRAEFEHVTNTANTNIPIYCTYYNIENYNDQQVLNHPTLQQQHVKNILKFTPNRYKFLFTTNSPYILSGVDKSNIRIVRGRQELWYEEPSFQTKGTTGDDILSRVLGGYPAAQTSEKLLYDRYLSKLDYGITPSISDRNKLINHFGELHPYILNLKQREK